MNELFENILFAFILLLIAGVLIAYAKNKKYNSYKTTSGSTNLQNKSFKVIVTHDLKTLDAELKICDNKIFISGDISVTIPFEKIENIQFPYALNTVIFKKGNIERIAANNLNLSPSKLMSTLFITFYNDKKLETYSIEMQESKHNFRINKIARAKLMLLIEKSIAINSI